MTHGCHTLAGGIARCHQHFCEPPPLAGPGGVTPKNAQGEYYLTDVIEILGQGGHHLDAVIAEDAREGLGVNDRKQLAAMATVMRERILDRLMADGVTVLDPASTYVDDTVKIGTDTVLYPGVTLEGHTVIGAECTVGRGSCVSASRLGERGRPDVLRLERGGVRTTFPGPFCTAPFIHVGGGEDRNFVELKNRRSAARQVPSSSMSATPRWAPT